MERLQQYIEPLGQSLKADFLAHPSWAYLDHLRMVTNFS